MFGRPRACALPSSRPLSRSIVRSRGRVRPDGHDHDHRPRRRQGRRPARHRRPPTVPADRSDHHDDDPRTAARDARVHAADQLRAPAPADDATGARPSSSARAARHRGRRSAASRPRGRSDVAARAQAEEARSDRAQDAAAARQDAHAPAPSRGRRRTSTRATRSSLDRDLGLPEHELRPSRPGSQLHVLGTFGSNQKQLLDEYLDLKQRVDAPGRADPRRVGAAPRPRAPTAKKHLARPRSTTIDDSRHAHRGRARRHPRLRRPRRRARRARSSDRAG